MISIRILNIINIKIGNIIDFIIDKLRSIFKGKYYFFVIL